MIIVHGKILSWKSLHGLQGHFQSTQFAVPSVCKFKLCCAKKKQTNQKFHETKNMIKKTHEC